MKSTPTRPLITFSSIIIIWASWRVIPYGMFGWDDFGEDKKTMENRRKNWWGLFGWKRREERKIVGPGYFLFGPVKI